MFDLIQHDLVCPVGPGSHFISVIIVGQTTLDVFLGDDGEPGRHGPHRVLTGLRAHHQTSLLRLFRLWTLHWDSYDRRGHRGGDLGGPFGRGPFDSRRRRFDRSLQRTCFTQRSLSEFDIFWNSFINLAPSVEGRAAERVEYCMASEVGEGRGHLTPGNLSSAPSPVSHFKFSSPHSYLRETISGRSSEFKKVTAQYWEKSIHKSRLYLICDLLVTFWQSGF